MLSVKFAHLEVTAVASAAAHALDVGLIQLSGIVAVVTLQERIFNSLNGKIKSPILAVNSNINIAAKRRINSEFRHHAVAKIILHIGVILNYIVKAELVESVIGFCAVVVIKFNLEAVAIVSVALHLRQRGVTLCSYRNIFICLVIYHDRARSVLLARTGFKEAVPIVYHDIYRVHL